MANRCIAPPRRGLRGRWHQVAFRARYRRAPYFLNGMMWPEKLVSKSSEVLGQVPGQKLVRPKLVLLRLLTRPRPPRRTTIGYGRLACPATRIIQALSL